jgi:hypothetical protein
MKALVLLVLFAIVVIGISFFFKGQSNSVNLYHICGKEVSWYDAMFLDPVEDKTNCEKYQ